MVLFARGYMKNKIRVSAFALTLYKSHIVTKYYAETMARWKVRAFALTF